MPIPAAQHQTMTCPTQAGARYLEREHTSMLYQNIPLQESRARQKHGNLQPKYVFAKCSTFTLSSKLVVLRLVPPVLLTKAVDVSNR